MTPQECAATGDMMGGMMGQIMGSGMIGSGMMGGWGTGLLWLGLLVAIVVIGVAAGVVLGRRPAAPGNDDPREILRRRFARGEINSEELAAALKTLG